MPTTPVLESLDDVRALIAAHDPDALLVPCDLRRLVVRPGAVHELPAVLAEVVGELPGRRARAVLLADETVILREGSDVKTDIELALSAHLDVTRVTLSDGHAELHVVDEVVETARTACLDADVVVALGGGTISDIGKLAAGPGTRVVSVMTAASVDGYTDNVSVTLKQGVKRTVPSRWPDAVVADAETVAGAPERMTRAGYGEMTSMYVAPADWRLAALMGVDPSFHPGPVALLAALSGQLDACAAGVAKSEAGAVQTLTWALALRGIATGVAGTTACLSGVEHLVSHMLDLRAAELGLPTGLHGEQVGAGSVVAACAWEMLHDRLATNPFARVRATALDADLAEARVRAAFDGFDPSGRIGTECWKDYSRKLDRVRSAVLTIDITLARWTTYAEELRALVRPSAVIAQGLRSAGAPALLGEIGSDVDAATVRWAVESCALMRDRFTVVDLLTVLGWWEEPDVDELFARIDASTTAVAVTS